MSQPLWGELGRAYAVAAISTTPVGVGGLAAGVDTETLALLVSLGTLVGYINLY